MIGLSPWSFVWRYMTKLTSGAAPVVLTVSSAAGLPLAHPDHISAFQVPARSESFVASTPTPADEAVSPATLSRATAALSRIRDAHDRVGVRFVRSRFM